MFSRHKTGLRTAGRKGWSVRPAPPAGLPQRGAAL